MNKLNVFLFVCFLLISACCTADEIPAEYRLQEYFCNREMEISPENRAAKFLRLRGLSLPNRLPAGVEVDDFYAKAVSRFRDHLPYVKYVSLVGDYEYSADDSTDEEELRAELSHVHRWLMAVVSAFYRHKIRIVEFELYATLGFEDSAPLQKAMNETFGHGMAPVSLDFCRIAFNCDLKFPLGFGNGEATISAELAAHVSRRPSGRRSANPASCEAEIPEDHADVHKLENFELNADGLPTAAFESKRLFHVQLAVPKDGRTPDYAAAVRNLRRKLPNVEKMKLRAQTFVTPRNSSDVAELKTQLRFLRRWAETVVAALEAENVDLLSFDLMATLRFDHEIPLDRVFREAFADLRGAKIDAFLSQNLFNAEIPLGGGGEHTLQAELLMSGGFKRRRTHVRRPTFTLKQLLGRS